MTHPHAGDLVSAFQELAKMDFSETTGFQFLKILRQKMIMMFDETTSEQIIARLAVEIPQGSMTQEQLEDLADALTTCFTHAEDALMKCGFNNTTDMLVRMASKFTAKLS